jgi:membrane-associated PAP2 superfamily phosphatase
MLKNNKQIVITTICLVIVILLFQFTQLDIFVQSFFYNFNTKTWLIDKDEPILKFFLYDGLKNLLLIFGVMILFTLIFLRKNSIVLKYEKGLIIVLLAAILIPSVVGLLKAFTNTPCPCNIVHLYQLTKF